MTDKILLVEDDTDIAELLDLHIQDLGYDLDHAADGEVGLEMALAGEYRLVILDLMLPKMDGMDVCKGIRAKKENLPILMLTSKSEEFDKVLGLELGADDYVTKPFGIRELMARIKALIRRSQPVEETDTREILTWGPLIIHLGKRRVERDGERIELTSKEFDLLVLFAKHPGRVYSRDHLLDLVWGYQFEGYNHTVNSHINRLRAKIETDPAHPDLIKTVWGVGYRFAEEEELGNDADSE
ncbi:MAG: response regulator transcription factor [Candidatus Latescibacteria bacterium]|jgi:two-component system, OmpR family, alkaline phosphatase synthesis response regulator PhoP|nr:response regulator transcription factor [Candidatus Latescibacterota bacterium]